MKFALVVLTGTIGCQSDTSGSHNHVKYSVSPCFFGAYGCKSAGRVREW